MNRIELLSPAKDLDTGMAAINCGADAIYMGAARFGAREAAGNPLGDIEQVARYAHKYWARVYVTVNTLLHDAELDEAQTLIRQLYEAGADALIIQDMGLLELDLPPLPLFASTQMHNHTPERVAFLEKVGFQRAILARELSLPQISEIHARTSIELETFVHGALCVGYSGQCYLSYAIGGRSGNRGQCAQPCRRPYSLLGRDGQPVVRGRYLLSLHDLNLSASLAELLDAGVTSFKIEGRLKDKAYVMNVVGHYRKQLDSLLEARALRPAASGAVHLDFEPNPARSFNRGFSTFFLHGRGAEIANPNTPKSLGEPLGKIVATNQRSFALDHDAPEVHNGDGLCFLDANQELAGTTAIRVENRTVFPASMAGLIVGTPIYRNHDRLFNDALEQSRSERKVRVNFQLWAQPGGLTLTATDEDGNQAEFAIEAEAPPAQQPEKARDTLERQLRKLGGTEFECGEVELLLEPLPFVPVGQLNALRRGVVELLSAARAQNRPQPRGGALVNEVPFPEKTLTFRGNVLNEKAAQFYRRHGVIQIEPAAETGLNLAGRRVMTTKYCLRYQLNACPRQPDHQKLPEPLRLIDEQGSEYPLRFNCSECVMEVYNHSLPGYGQSD